MALRLINSAVYEIVSVDRHVISLVGLVVGAASLILGTVSLFLTIRYNREQANINRAVMNSIDKIIESKKFNKSKKVEMIKSRNINLTGIDLYKSKININIGGYRNDREET